MEFDNLFDEKFNGTIQAKDSEKLKDYLLKKQGWIYIAYSQNEELLKIGRTGKNPLERAKTLSTTGVVHDYQILFALEVFNQFIAERKVHHKLKKFRFSSKKEFFSVKREVAIAALEKICAEETQLLQRFLNTSIIKEDIDLLEYALHK